MKGYLSATSGPCTLSLSLSARASPLSVSGLITCGDTQPTVFAPLQSLLYEPTCCLDLLLLALLPEGICKFSFSVTLSLLPTCFTLHFWCSGGCDTYFDLFSARLSSISLQLNELLDVSCLLSWDQFLHLYASLFSFFLQSKFSVV